tara:strand:- start:5851 stop:7086 length:1236 start_codon:yes stop_codon:yes gene_type:complete
MSTVFTSVSGRSMKNRWKVWPEKFVCRILSKISCGSIKIKMPSGRVFRYTADQTGPAAEIHVCRWKFLLNTLWGGHSEFFEGYLRGDWVTNDLFSLLLFGERNKTCIDEIFHISLGHRFINRISHSANNNSRKGSRRNIAAHYNLGNDFYRLWLDNGMTYSSALFKNDSQTLADAQQNKYQRLIDIAQLKTGDRVLEIGCGWGGLAEVAARDYGCTVTALTLSKPQADYCEKRFKKLGLEDRVKVLLKDYRDVEGQFDKIISIEMLEAVGEKFWPLYFKTIRNRLAPGGKAVIQSITIDGDKFKKYRKNPDFIQKYIFPGGMLPSEFKIESLSDRMGLIIKNRFFFGDSYVKTLRLWHDEFTKNWTHIKTLGFDEDFRRKWTYYLNYCAAGFQSGRVNVGHFLFEHKLKNK